MNKFGIGPSSCDRGQGGGFSNHPVPLPPGLGILDYSIVNHTTYLFHISSELPVRSNGSETWLGSRTQVNLGGRLPLLQLPPRTVHEEKPESAKDSNRVARRLGFLGSQVHGYFYESHHSWEFYEKEPAHIYSQPCIHTLVPSLYEKVAYVGVFHTYSLLNFLHHAYDLALGWWVMV